MQPNTAVIILNWNGRKLLQKFLPSVLRHTPPERGRVIVADNGSDDDSLQWLRENHPEVETIVFDRNHGFAEGYNLALKLVEKRFPFTVLLNSDVEVKDDWLSPLVDFMESHPEAAACQPKIMSLADPGRFEYAGASGGFIDRHGYPFCRGRVFAECEEDKGQYDTPMAVDWASGAALMVRTSLYLEAGGLDPSFFAHMEEIDLCWRFRCMGHTVAVVPQASVYHLGGGSLPPSSPRKTYLNYRNNLLMLHKNLPTTCRKSLLLKRRLLDGVAWAKEVATLKWGNAAAILRAHRDYRTMRKQIADTPDTPERISQAALMASRPDIVAGYFIHGRRRFSDYPELRDV